MKVFVDMDGTVANFSGAFLPLIKLKLGETIRPDEITTYDRLARPEYQRLLHTPGLFWNLAPISGSKQNLELAHGDGHQLFILSASESSSYTDKFDWVREHLPFIDPRNIVFAKCKGELADPGKVLIDDATHNLQDWRDAGGIAICYDQRWNQDWDGLRIKEWHELRSLLNAIRKRQIVFLSLSGSGKSTTKNLLLQTGAFHSGITCATRKQREREADGVDYDFITVKEYAAAVESGRMSEHTNYLGGTSTPYGILRHRIEATESSPLPTVWVLNGEGLKWMQEHFGTKNVTPIFLWTDKETLRYRMVRRGDADPDITKRLAAYDAEVDEGTRLADIVIDVTRMKPVQVRDAVIKRLSEV